MSDGRDGKDAFGWNRVDVERRQLRAGLEMTPAERLDWLEEMLDELLGLVGGARDPGDSPGVEPIEGERG